MSAIGFALICNGIALLIYSMKGRELERRIERLEEDQ